MNETDIYREWAPPSGWDEVVACCWEQRVSAARVQRVLPDGHADLIMYDTGKRQAAAATGYADQPHLTRDVRRFCGIAPARLVRERRSG